MICRQVRAETLQMFYALNKFTVYTNYFNTFEENDEFDPVTEYYYKACQKQISETTSWFAQIGSRNARLAKRVTINLGIIELEPLSDGLWVAEAWDIATLEEVGLINRGPIAALRDVSIEFAIRTYSLSDAGKMRKLSPRYYFPYGTEKADTRVALQRTFDVIDEGAVTGGLSGWAERVFVHWHQAVSEAVLRHSR
ncbi:hypothetical protein B0A55_07467, partial [Friedmanniomyces simplex]